ncbi:MAG: hypothetical protein ACPL1D_01565 [Microgenomates group bacterium]
MFYLNSYLKQGLKFNIFLFQLKVIKFWIDHSITNLPFASILLFLLGIFKKWWDNYEFTFSHLYSIFWPVSFLSCLYLIKKNLFFRWRQLFKLAKKGGSIFNTIGEKIELLKKIFRKKPDLKFLTFSITPLYLLYLGAQAPFVRYFVIILPFSYLSLAYFLKEYILKIKR